MSGMYRPRALSPELQRKSDRIQAVVAKRHRLARIRAALARIAAELEHGLREQRRTAVAGSEHCREARLLAEVKTLRQDVDELEA
jgi:hypothetical protein